MFREGVADLMEHLLELDGTDEVSAAYWQQKGAELIIIKHGKQGSRAYSRHDGNWNVKPFPVDALKAV